MRFCCTWRPFLLFQSDRGSEVRGYDRSSTHRSARLAMMAVADRPPRSCTRRRPFTRLHPPFETKLIADSNPTGSGSVFRSNRAFSSRFLHPFFPVRSRSPPSLGTGFGSSLEATVRRFRWKGSSSRWIAPPRYRSRSIPCVCQPRTWHSQDTKVGGAMAMATDVSRLSDEQELALRRLGALSNVRLDPRGGTHAFQGED